VSGRIVTLTLSPALDATTSVEVVRPTHKMRCAAPSHDPGGGGINVARVAVRLGGDVVAVAPLGGATGDQVAILLADEHVVLHRVPTSMPTRQSFTVDERVSGNQFRFVMPAPPLASAVIDQCIEALVAAAGGAGCVVVSGSVPEGTPLDLVSRIVRRVHPVPVVVDTSGPALVAALEADAALVKPSATELSIVVGRPLDTERDVEHAACEVVAGGRARAVLVSIGAGGAFLVERGSERPVRFRAPAVRVVSAVGAGDSMIAGLAVGLCRGDDLHTAVRLGIAAGTATVLTAGTHLCDARDVDDLVDLVSVDG
jgi:6-phosphofructokinase 2